MASVHPYTTGAGRRWKVAYRDVDGRQRTKGGFTRKGDADRYADELDRMGRMGTLGMLSRSSMTFGAYIEERWVPNHAAQLAPSTRSNYAGLVEHHLEDVFRDVPLQRITPDRIRDWQRERLASTPANADGRYAVMRAQRLLRSILQRAAEDGYLDRNPADVVRAVRMPSRRAVRPLAPSAVERLRRAARSHRDRALISVLAYAGVRPGEALALEWRDVRDRTLLVEKATDGFGAIKGTKTSEHRTVTMLHNLAGDLREWRMASGRPAATRLVFPTHDLTAFTKIDWGNWRNRNWSNVWASAGDDAAREAGHDLGTDAARDAAQAAGVDPAARARPYDLRHSFASLLLASGWQAHSVAKQLGHSAEMTIKTYGHVIEEYEGQPPIDPDEEISKARAA